MNEELRNEIIRRWQGGASLRRLARELGLARETVQAVVRRWQAGRAGQEESGRTRRPSLVDPYEETIRQLLLRYPDITITRVYEELRGQGFGGKRTIVRERVLQLRPQPVRQPVQRFETAPGAQAQMDYSSYDIDFADEGRRRVHLFSYLLGYSRRQYLRFVEAQDLATTLREHVRAFEHLGGVAASCLYDNMKVVVLRHTEEGPLYNPRFLAFATHHGFRPIACVPHRPQTKGKVERPFWYAESNLLCGRTFRGLEHLNSVTAWWLENVADVRVHRETRQRPIDRHALERPHLIALPQTPYDLATVTYRVVNVEGFVAYQQNYYSVPFRHIGCALAVRVTETELIVYGPQLEEVARHRLLPRGVAGQRCCQREHRPSSDARQHEAVLRERYAELGPVAVDFLQGLLQQQRQGRNQAGKVLALLGSYARADLLAALERAVRFGAYSLAAVERILAVQAQPRGILETLAEQHEPQLPSWLRDNPVSQRPTADYLHLVEGTTDHDTPQPHADASDAGAPRPDDGGPA